MDGVVGTLFLAAATLLFAGAIVEYRRPNSGRWTRTEFSAVAIVLTTMSLFTIGVGSLVGFLVPLNELHLTGAEAALIGAIIVVTWIGLRALWRRWKRLNVSEGARIETPSNIAPFPSDPSPQEPSPDGRSPRLLSKGKRAGRRKAA